jgi:hypothetical protein
MYDLILTTHTVLNKIPDLGYYFKQCLLGSALINTNTQSLPSGKYSKGFTFESTR